MLQENPNNVMALRCQARLRKWAVLDSELGRVPGQFVPAARSELQFLQSEPTHSKIEEQYCQTLDNIKVYRPYPEWSSRKKQFGGGAGHWEDRRADEKSEPAKAEPAHWDFVMRRIEDILTSEEDKQRTRAILFGYIDVLLSIYRYYSALTYRSVDEQTRIFAMKPPKRINLENLDDQALQEFRAMWGMSTPDMPMPADRPNTLITLRQCWALGTDCCFVSSVLQRADLSRIFLFSSRETNDSTVGGVEISECDEANPHHPNNQAHIYEFLEFIIRVANAQYGKHGAARQPLPDLCSRFYQLIIDHLLPYSCTHDMNCDGTSWVIRRPSVRATLRTHQAAIGAFPLVANRYSYCSIRCELRFRL